jgi:chromosome segregation ATPase
MANPFYEWLGLDQLEAKLDQIVDKLDNILQAQQAAKETDMAEAQEIANLVQQVTANRDAVQAGTTAMQGLVQTVADLQTELQSAIANSTDVSPEIKAAADDLMANTQALQQAIPQLARAIVAGTKAA